MEDISERNFGEWYQNTRNSGWGVARL